MQAEDEADDEDEAEDEEMEDDAIDGLVVQNEVRMIFDNQNVLMDDELADSEEDDMMDMWRKKWLPLQNRPWESPELRSRTIRCIL